VTGRIQGHQGGGELGLTTLVVSGAVADVSIGAVISVVVGPTKADTRNGSFGRNSARELPESAQRICQHHLTRRSAVHAHQFRARHEDGEAPCA